MLRAWLAATLSLSALSAQALVLAVNEGVTYRVPNEEVRARYAALAADIGKLLGQPVSVEPVGDYNQLRKGLAEKSYDLAIVHPAHVSIAALRKGWQLVAVSKGFENYSANFLVRADSPLKSLADLRGAKLGAPDEDSITAWMVRATMRDALGQGNAVAVTYTRYQDAVPFMVENRFTQAGATASAAVVKTWLAQGGKVLTKSKPVPIKHFIASPLISPDAVARLREYLISLDTSDDGRKRLEPIRIKGYVAWDSAALLGLGTWLGL
jgi:ABC-type phosphate/phosphonate transport system substrate-binding protein